MKTMNTTLLNASLSVKNSCINNKIFTQKCVKFHSNGYLYSSENGPVYLHICSYTKSRLDPGVSYQVDSQMHGSIRYSITYCMYW